MSELEVRFEARVVGRLRIDDEQRLCFSYAPSWLADDRTFPVSLSLPLRDAEYVGGAGQWFFSNLLPEGGVREAVCAKLGISVDNDPALLRAIGGECAGALSIVDADAPVPDPERHRYEVLEPRRLQDLVDGDRVVPLLVGGAATRLSLAGAQDKLPVAKLDGEIQLPLALAPSTHILKLPSRRLPDLTVNEAFVMGLAARLGLDVVEVELLTVTEPPSLLVTRYDRRPSEEAWPAIRLHQEDLCQALGLPHTRKYQQEGGPTLVAAIEVVRDHVRQPQVDVPRVLAWQALNVVVGNSDGHGKNLSILHDGGLRLAPFYDLLATRHYDSLDRLLAMSVGGRRDPDTIGRDQWNTLATELGIASRVVHQTVHDVAEHCADTMTAWSTEFRRRHGDQPLMQTLPRAIARRAQRVLGA